MFKTKLTNKLFLMSFLTLSFSISSFAQEVEEVVVTATKKEESTQDIAISVEAFTSDMLDSEQIYDLSDLTEVVPGFGFGKTVNHNYQLLKSLSSFQDLGFPLLVGISRKSMIGEVVNRPVKERIYGTIAATILAISNGASVIRTHDVAATMDAIRVHCTYRNV